MGDTILKVEHIDKKFGNHYALKDVQFDLRAGEVHALMGENGAGKSTLVKIISGVYHRTAGDMWYMGEKRVFDNPKQAQEAGIAIVHQELNMMEDLTVAENIYIGREDTKGGLIDDKKMVENARKLFDLLEVDIDPNMVVRQLPVGLQQITEIAKALSMDAKLIVFDEPTTSLADDEIDILFKIIDYLKSQGIGIIYISHRMKEIGQVADRVTVMRDGQYVWTKDVENLSRDDIIHAMVGRVNYVEPKTESQVADDAPVVLEAKQLNRGRWVKDVSFKLRKGEILGFSGLMGAGRSETARLIFGADPMESGEIWVDGKKADIKNTDDAVSYGIGYLSEDRRTDGMVTDFNVANNISLCSVPDFIDNGLIDDSKIVDVSEKYIDRLDIKCNSPLQIVKTLSGGNQQKVIIAKWLLARSKILIFDEPTKGIDVGAKNEIYKLIQYLANQGKSIIMISSELEEILRLSDRVLVMSEGRKTAEFPIEEANQNKIMHYATLEEEETYD